MRRTPRATFSASRSFAMSTRYLRERLRTDRPERCVYPPRIACRLVAVSRPRYGGGHRFAPAAGTSRSCRPLSAVGVTPCPTPRESDLPARLPWASSQSPSSPAPSGGSGDSLEALTGIVGTGTTRQTCLRWLVRLQRSQRSSVRVSASCLPAVVTGATRHRRDRRRGAPSRRD